MLQKDYSYPAHLEAMGSVLSRFRSDTIMNTVSSVANSVGLSWVRSLEEISKSIGNMGYAITSIVRDENNFIKSGVLKRYAGCIQLNQISRTNDFKKLRTEQRDLTLQGIKVGVMDGLDTDFMTVVSILESATKDLSTNYLAKYLNAIDNVIASIKQDPKLLANYKLDLNKIVVEEFKTIKSKKSDKTATISELKEQDVLRSEVEKVNKDIETIINPTLKQDTRDAKYLLKNNVSNIVILTNKLLKLEKEFDYEVLNAFNLIIDNIFVNIKKLALAVDQSDMQAAKDDNPTAFYKKNLTAVRDMIYLTATTVTAYSSLVFIYHTTVSSTVNMARSIQGVINRM